VIGVTLGLDIGPSAADEAYARSMVGSQHHILVFGDAELLADNGNAAVEELDRLSTEGWDVLTVVTTAASEHVFLLRYKPPPGGGGGR